MVQGDMWSPNMFRPRSSQGYHRVIRYTESDRWLETCKDPGLPSPSDMKRKRDDGRVDRELEITMKTMRMMTRRRKE